ncbi:lipoyltransferase [Gonapodya prolifera JEL478]|uniref:lipoyl(octanoyl) transferase n=1 Tax=Gonapodya prolifera (strain JEL478) TaxID=1344416 RepID=A0A139ASK5_GONPJ|nr:lipoyltransferase [Gonapodya prolifera JEL478]|eukprot:KXS19728.1 lipoyltransferase [Gonapodya prolifera JEL478]
MLTYRRKLLAASSLHSRYSRACVSEVVARWTRALKTSAAVAAASQSSEAVNQAFQPACATSASPPSPWDRLNLDDAATRAPIAYKYIPHLPYHTGLKLQEALVQRRVAMMDEAEKSATSGQKDLNIGQGPSSRLPIDVILLLQHDPVYTGGRRIRGASSASEGLRLRELTGADYHETLRGGQLTYHGPGQLVGYPILALTTKGGYGYSEEMRKMGRLPVRCYVSLLEHMMINVAARYGIPASVTQNTGVWVPGKSRVTELKDENKIGAIGIHLTHNVTSHGFALNCTTDLSYFDQIIACGLPDKGATSIAVETPIWKDYQSLLPNGTTPGEVFVEAVVPVVVDEMEKVLARKLVNLDASDDSAWKTGRSAADLESIEESFEDIRDLIQRTLY